jgi:hypothetical protein
MMRRNPLSGRNQVALGPLSSFFVPSEQFRPESTENVTLNHLVQKFGVTDSVRSSVKWSETNQFEILSDFRNEPGRLLLMLKKNHSSPERAYRNSEPFANQTGPWW